MRVTLLAGHLGLGGTGKQVVLLANGLAERGHQATVLLTHGGGPREDDLDPAVRCVRLGFQPGSERRLTERRNAPAFTRLVRGLRGERPDVLHSFPPDGHLAAVPAARLARVPVIVAGRRGPDPRPVRTAERLVNRYTDHIVCNAQAVAAAVRRREGLPTDRMSVILDGLPDDAYAHLTLLESRTRRPHVLCVADLMPDKGHRYLLDALAMLRDRGVKMGLTLIGEGPESAALERRAAELDLPVRFEGARPDLARFLPTADLMVSPALAEGLSNAIMEAMAAGLPIVGTDVGGTPELLTDRGLLVPPRDAGALAAAMERLVADRVLAERLGARARAWSRRHLTAEGMVDRHLELYGYLLGE